MKNIIYCAFKFFLLFLISCSHEQYVRMPAQHEDLFLKESFEEILSIPLSSEDDLGPKASLDLFKNKNVKIILSDDLPKNVASLIRIEKRSATDSALVLRVYCSSFALKDKEIITKLPIFATYLAQMPFEIYFNAREGDPRGIKDLLEVREAFFPSPKIKEIKDKLTIYLKDLERQQDDEKIIRKSGLKALDNLPESEQFRALVAKGDRKGAASLIRSYLPWEEMAPFEKKFWENYLEVVVKPVPLEQRVLVYRGIDGDATYSSFSGGKKISAEEAQKEGRSFVMSTLMTKNQGSWNRRLRSLESMNKKEIARGTYPSAARLNNLLFNHADSPQGSPFLSFSPRYQVALVFGRDNTGAYLIDPRLLTYNYASLFGYEIEFLVPLTTFPDELVAIDNHSLGNGRQDYLNKSLEQLLEKEYGPQKTAVLERIKNNSLNFFSKKLTDPSMDEIPTGPSQGQANFEFYKKFLGANDVKPTLSPDGNLMCEDLIKAIWDGVK